MIRRSHRQRRARGGEARGGISDRRGVATDDVLGLVGVMVKL